MGYGNGALLLILKQTAVTLNGLLLSREINNGSEPHFNPRNYHFPPPPCSVYNEYEAEIPVLPDYENHQLHGECSHVTVLLCLLCDLILVWLLLILRYPFELTVFSVIFG
ncbi:hypothetical protein VNO77_02174 [Canavalia gladiata]|uniref:Uncharacterized protein n=1 Tax=Canavalia gladiata TaxID=3824 RepID=A0AAN9MT50_CANGL